MAQPLQTPPSSPPEGNQDQNLNRDVSPEGAYTTPMRIFGGIAWGTLLSLLIAMGCWAVPQFPRSWLWGIFGLWVLLSGLGIALQWSVARGACPKCGLVQTVPALGKRCPECRSYLKASQRQVVRF
ncbi:hypothetical protein [Lyngbya confervoides]|uniref:Uncharacterized protein n=1 Tax=Lyngbya confervoides BDU141951 TaxID=1574623 RepID=A0ABD4SYF6_9CYAN|nr:hypothetical protein [Lyngbya confervoides]MCM1981313.1 hypothetical protein [Lyngbya confervoides BDU141951]